VRVKERVRKNASDENDSFSSIMLRVILMMWIRFGTTFK
jgi:hypothetical protein